MKHPPEVGQLLARRFAANHGGWLVADSADQHWPMTIALGMPTEREALRQTEAVRAWVAAWSGWQGAGELGWVLRQWKVLGAQRLPATLTLSGPQDAARWAGQHERWQRAAERFGVLTARWPALARRLARLFGVLADYDDDDFERLVEVLAWLRANPASGLYPRQLPVLGVDSKWMETRKGVLVELVASLRECPAEAGDFYSMCGLKRPPAQIRMRILDPHLRAQLGALGDVSAPVQELARLALRVEKVIIVENLQTGLAFADAPGTVVFMGLGYSVDLLAQLPWLQGARCVYWGDLDTHGFGILNRARSYFPALESALMDMDTLHRFRTLWTDEKMQNPAQELNFLKPEEMAVYRCLKQNTFAQNVRLEQERIAWDYACSALALVRFPARDGAGS